MCENLLADVVIREQELHAELLGSLLQPWQQLLDQLKLSDRRLGQALNRPANSSVKLSF